MTRISYQNPSPGTNPIADAIRLRRGSRGLSPLDQALLNAPEYANGWNTLLGSVRTKNSLPDDIRELIILRVAARNFAKFEWFQHASVAVIAGVTSAQLTIARDLCTPLPTILSPAPLTSFQAAALRYADASTWSVVVPDIIIEELKQFLEEEKDQKLMEVVGTCATYNMVSRLLVALDVAEMSSQLLPLPECTESEQFIRMKDGTNLFVKTAVRTAQESGKWLIFVNSLMTNCSMWDAVLPRLSKTYNLLCFDQRGHGQSDVPSTPATLEILASDIATIISSLSLPTPLYSLIGVSQGGATALALSHSHPNLFSNFIICDTQATAPPTNSQVWEDRIILARKFGMKELAKVTIPRWFPKLSEFRKQGRRGNLIESMIINTTVEGFVVGAKTLQSYDLLPNLSETLKGKNVLLMAGERDGILPKVLGELNEVLIKGGVKSKMVVVEGSGHLPMIDNPVEWLDAVENFLKE